MQSQFHLDSQLVLNFTFLLDFGLMMRRVLIGVTLALVATASANASDRIVGAGANVTCEEWSAARAVEDGHNKATTIVQMTTSWVQGFMGGLNMAAGFSSSKREFDVPSVRMLQSLLDVACKDGPDASIFAASMMVAVPLMPIPSSK